MTEGHAPSYRATETGVPTLATLSARILTALGVTAVGIVAIDGLLAAIEPDGLVRVGISVLIGVGIAGAAVTLLLVRPLVASIADLEGRYRAVTATPLRDPLTELGNHRAFQDEFDRQIEHSRRHAAPLSLVLIDLDEFTQINESAGHAAGDELLASFGALARSVLRGADRPFRIGGDEFAILLPHTDAETAQVVARRLLVSALQPALRDPRLKPLSFSAGVSALPDPASDRSQLYAQADAALHAAKRAGRTEVFVFDPGEAIAASPADDSLAVADVLARNLLRPVFQPVVELATQTTIGYGGLIRPVSPAPFADPVSLFAAAAASGHTVPLDLACAEAIVAAAARLPKGLFLSVNFSVRTIEAPEFSTSSLLELLERYGFPADRLVIELTERERIEDLEGVRQKLAAVRRAGVRLAADNLGAGNAGLRLLSDLRFDVLKVDLGLVQRTAPGAPSSAVVESIVAFASRTGALVIGEGVEQEEQMAQLVRLGVTAAQGYLFSRPGPLPDWEGEHRLARSEPHGADAEQLVDAAHEAWRRSIGLESPGTREREHLTPEPTAAGARPRPRAPAGRSKSLRRQSR